MTITKLNIHLELRSFVCEGVDDNDTEAIRDLLTSNEIRRRFFYFDYEEDNHSCQFVFTTNYTFLEALKLLKNCYDVQKVVLV